MFCCGVQQNDKNQLVVFDPHSIKHRFCSKKKAQFNSLLHDTTQYIILKGSKYNEYVQTCKSKGEKFVDPEFPPNDTSLNYKSNRPVSWKRITEILKSPQIIQGKIQPSDVQQGNIGDCYFLASLSALAEETTRIQKIFMNNLEINDMGIYKLMVNTNGEPKQIVIDDYIPVYANSNRTVFCKPNGNQAWVLLMEKAWAKISGSYGNISAGYPHQVLNTFAISPCYYFELTALYNGSEQQKLKVWSILLEAEQKNWPTCAGSKHKHVCKGIKSAHTYTLLGCYNVPINGRNNRIVKLRNPWGDTQFIGSFSQKDTAFWDKVPSNIKNRVLQKKSANDGIFTIEFQQFLRNFQSLDIVHYQSSYNYDFESINLKRGEPQYFLVEIQTEGQLYVTFQKSFNRDLFVKQKLLDYGYSKILVARKLGENNFEYVDSKLQPNFPDVTLRCPKIQPGKYIIYIKSGFYKNLQYQDATVSLYSNSVMNIQICGKPHPQFLKKVFLHHAFAYAQKNLIGADKNDWVATKLLYDEGGFGYIAANLSQYSKKKISIDADAKKIAESGYYIQESNQTSVKKIVEPGNSEIVVLGVDLQKQAGTSELVFPPQGLKVTKII